MAEDSKHNVVQDLRIEEHERRINTMEESIQTLLISTTALNASVEQTNVYLKNGFDLMKKLAGTIIGVLSVVIGGTQVM